MVRNYIPIPEDQKKKRGPKGKQIPQEIIDRIIELRKIGVTFKKISSTTNVSWFLIKKILRNNSNN